MAGSRSDLIYRFTGTAVLVTSVHAVPLQSKLQQQVRWVWIVQRVVHDNDDSGPNSAEIDDVERKDPTGRNQNSRFPR